MEEEQGMAAKPCGVAEDGGGIAAGFAGDLAVAGAGEEAEGGGGEHVGALEPVGGAEALGAEGVTAVDTPEAGDAVW
jgi:hypothetical protein